QRFYFHGGELQRCFLGKTLHVLYQDVRSLGILANFPRQGATPGFTMRARSDNRDLLPDNNHGLPDLVGDAGHQFAKRSQLVALHQMILEAVDAGVRTREATKRTTKICTQKILLDGKQQSEKKDCDQGDVKAERKKPVMGSVG